MANEQFNHPRLAPLYDLFDGSREDLQPYIDMAEALSASCVVDVGCGTGVLACLLAQRGKNVVGVDPAAASLEVARAKTFSERVTWLQGDASAVPDVAADMAVMTANVAQVFKTDEEWHTNLHHIHRALRPGGTLMFEARDPTARAWESWTKDKTFREVKIEGAGQVSLWCEVLKVEGPLVTFQWTFLFADEGAELVSTSTLRFRTRQQIEQSLQDTGFTVGEVRGAADRPGLEMVFIATRA